MKKLLFPCLSSMILLGACAALPQPEPKPAELTGTVAVGDTTPARSATMVIEVDGKPNQDKVAKVLSGQRSVRIQALPITGHRGGEVRSMNLNVKPCTRYHLNVQRKNQEAMDWEPVIAREEPIQGCVK